MLLSFPLTGGPGREAPRAAGGPGDKLHSLPERTRAFAVHPSGKRMAFTQSRTNYELWVLENFLPTPQAAR
jgi:hypothetical protein